METNQKIVISKRGKIPLPVLIILAVLCFLPLYVRNLYVLHIAITLALTGALASSYNLSAGYAGQATFSHAAFYGIGAYIVAILGERFSISVWVCMPIAFVGAVLTSFLVGLPTLKLRGIYRIQCTIAFQVIFDTIILHWVDVTHGAVGFSSIAAPVFFGIKLATPSTFYYLAYAWLLINVLILWRLESSRLGFELLAIAGNESAADACGVNLRQRKLWAFSASAGLAAVTGCIFASYARAIGPSTFNISYSAVILCLALLGGSGKLFGGIVGAVILGIIPEVARVIQDYRMLVYGLLMVLIVIYMPDGVLGMASKLTSRLHDSLSSAKAKKHAKE